MKKGIIVLLLVALVAGTAFAGFSGNANIQFTGDLDKKNFGFTDKTPMSFSFTLDSEKVTVGEEDGIHAELEASVKIIIDRARAATATAEAAASFNRVWSDDLSNNDLMLGVVASVGTAKIVGDGWYVSILGPKSVYDYAKAAVQYSYNTTYDAFGVSRGRHTASTMSYSVPYAKTSNGVTAGYQGYTVSAGFDYLGTASSDNVGARFSATAETKSFKFADDAVTVQAAAEISKGYDKTDGTKGALNAGFNGKASFTMDKVSASVAADLGLKNLNTETDAGADVRVDAAYDFVSGSVYFAKDGGIGYFEEDTATSTDTKKSYAGTYLEAKVDVDLNAFDVPVTVGITAQNLTQSKLDGADKGMVFGASADYAKDAITAGAGASLDLTDKSWDVNVYASYAAEKYTAGAGCYIENDGTEMSALSLGGFVESDAIVKNATIGAQYGLSTSYFFNYGGDYCTGNAKYSNNFLADEAGAMSLYCKIAF